MADSSDRLHGLDAVRGYALMLGVVFHATMSFLPGPQQIWMVKDTESSQFLAGLFFWSHTFRMTTFFLIAGFFAHMTFHRRGAKGFISDRLKRIALPLVIFLPLCLVAIVMASGYAIYVATGTFPTKPPPQPPAPPLSFPLTHLWFLYVLLWFYAVALVVRGVIAKLDAGGTLRSRVDRIVAALLRHPAAPIGLAAPVATAFYLTPSWLAFFGVPTPDMNLIPNPVAAIQYGLAFGLGWLIHRQVELLNGIRARWPLNLAIAAAMTAAGLAMQGLTPVTTPDQPGLTKALHAATYALAIWAWTFAVVGMALRFLSRASRVRRYIADSSYWIYVIHLPLVIFLQAWVSRLDWPWTLKFAVVLGVGFAIMFATYELFVRHTFIGTMLNGRRVPWRHPKTASATGLETA